jgi:hypothetical protein
MQRLPTGRVTSFRTITPDVRYPQQSGMSDFQSFNRKPAVPDPPTKQSLVWPIGAYRNRRANLLADKSA